LSVKTFGNEPCRIAICIFLCVSMHVRLSACNKGRIVRNKILYCGILHEFFGAQTFVKVPKLQRTFASTYICICARLAIQVLQKKCFQQVTNKPETYFMPITLRFKSPSHASSTGKCRVVTKRFPYLKVLSYSSYSIQFISSFLQNFLYPFFSKSVGVLLYFSSPILQLAKPLWCTFQLPTLLPAKTLSFVLMISSL
jgi:hypothetical protein